MDQTLQNLIDAVIAQYNRDAEESMFMRESDLREPPHRNLRELSKKLKPFINLDQIDDRARVYPTSSILEGKYSVVLWSTQWTYTTEYRGLCGVVVELHADGSWYFASSSRYYDAELRESLMVGPWQLDEIKAMGNLLFDSL